MAEVRSNSLTRLLLQTNAYLRLGFSTGSSASPMYDGARLADEHDVVIVTFKYDLLESYILEAKTD
jgi:hypothetical protein